MFCDIFDIELVILMKDLSKRYHYN